MRVLTWTITSISALIRRMRIAWHEIATRGREATRSLPTSVRRRHLFDNETALGLYYSVHGRRVTKALPLYGFDRHEEWAWPCLRRRRLRAGLPPHPHSGNGGNSFRHRTWLRWRRRGRLALPHAAPGGRRGVGARHGRPWRRPLALVGAHCAAHCPRACCEARTGPPPLSPSPPPPSAPRRSAAAASATVVAVDLTTHPRRRRCSSPPAAAAATRTATRPTTAGYHAASRGPTLPSPTPLRSSAMTTVAATSAARAAADAASGRPGRGRHLDAISPPPGGGDSSRGQQRSGDGSGYRRAADRRPHGRRGGNASRVLLKRV